MVMDSGDMAGMVITSVITIAIAATIILRGPVGRALGRAIEIGAGGGRSADDEARVAHLEQRVAELEAGQGRLAELEERVDFAERLLSRPDAPVRIPGRHEGP